MLKYYFGIFILYFIIKIKYLYPLLGYFKLVRLVVAGVAGRFDFFEGFDSLSRWF